MEQGKTIVEATVEIARAVDTLRWMAGAVSLIGSRQMERVRGDLEREVRREPIGPVIGIVPWNFPAVLMARKIGAAIAAGCPIVVKAPEETPALVNAFEAAFQGGISQVVQFVFASPTIIRMLIDHPGIKAVSFTGSTRVGRLVAAYAATGPKPCVLELGGNAPVVVLPDADVDRAVLQLAMAKFASAGQSCGAPSRFLVHESIVERFANSFARLLPRPDDHQSSDSRGLMGPVMNYARVAVLESLIDDAVSTGATVFARGLPSIHREGTYVPPAILTNVSPSARVMQEEPFGPIVPIVAWSDLDDAVELANSTDAELSAYVFGTEQVDIVTSRLRAGSVTINATATAAPDLPLGGRAASGYGYEGGLEGILEYTVAKIVQRPTRIESEAD